MRFSHCEKKGRRMTTLNRAQRRLLARAGLAPSLVGRAFNRVAPPAPDPKVGAVPKTTGEWKHYLDGLDTPEKFAEAHQDGSFKANLAGYVDAQNSERID